MVRPTKPNTKKLRNRTLIISPSALYEASFRYSISFFESVTDGMLTQLCSSQWISYASITSLVSLSFSFLITVHQPLVVKLYKLYF